MGKRFARSAGVLATALLVGALAWGVAPASAEVDTTPPTLVTPERSSWAVGTQIVTVDYCDPEDQLTYTTARQVIGWTASDDSGAVASSAVRHVEIYPDADAPIDLAPSATRFTEQVYNWTNACGGGESYSPLWWTVGATDASGNSVSAEVSGGEFSATQEDGTDGGYHWSGSDVELSFSPDWRRVSGRTASAGGFARTTRAGSWVDVHVTHLNRDSFDGVHLPATGTNVGLVMRKGPKAAAFDLYRNGEWVARVDPYAPHSRPRMIVWQGWAELDDTLRLVRADGLHPGSSAQGRAIMTLDAVLAN